MQDQYTVDADSDYESDAEGQPLSGQETFVVAPIDQAVTRAALRSTSKEKAPTPTPSSSMTETESPTPPTPEAGVLLQLPTRTEFIAAQTDIPQWKALRSFIAWDPLI